MMQIMKRNMSKFLTILFVSINFLLLSSNCNAAEAAAGGGPGVGQNSNNNNDKIRKAASSSSKISLITINEDDWEQMLQGEWMVEFHAPWCPACRALQPEWKSFSSWGSDLGIKVGAVDVTANPGLSGRFMVTALPTIYHVIDGVFRQYKGTRDTNAFVSFIEEKKWQSIEPLSSWKSPQSIPMSIVSNFFKISMALRAIHNSLVEDYGIPYWGSYILFAFATILFGALLGLIIVCLIDIIFPARTPEEILARPATSDLIDDMEDDKRPLASRSQSEESNDDTEEDEEDEFDEEDDGDSGPEIEEVEDIKPESSPEQSKRTNVRLRKARRD